MNIFFRSSLLLLICCTCIAEPTQAQFWKKLNKKEQKKSKPKSNKNKIPPQKEVVRLKKRVEPEYPESTKKEIYRIDILLPLHLNSLVKNGKAVVKRPPDYALPAINFYEGIALAAEALKSKNTKLDVHIHDITESNNQIPALISTQKLQNTDLIIGLLQSADIPAIANYAQKNKVNFISALSPADAGVKANPYFVLVQPTLKTHINHLISIANKKFGKNPKYIFQNSNTSGEKDAYMQLREALSEEKDLTVVDCSKYRMSTDSLSKLFDSTQTNVVFISVLEIAHAEQILNALAQLPKRYHFEIFGMPSWKSLRGLTNPSSYMELSIYYTSPFFYDPTTGPGKNVQTAYKNVYGGVPSEMVYRGYETLYWTSNMLEKYGTIFNNNFSDVSAAPFTRYEIEPAWSPQNDYLYLENKKLSVFHYQNGGFIIEQD